MNLKRKKLIEETIRFRFDHKDTSQGTSIKLIALSISLNLTNDFIDELQNDYEQHFNTKL